MPESAPHQIPTQLATAPDIGYGYYNANCNGCTSRWVTKHTALVGSFSPNKFGLNDMVGNVWEWTEDCYHDSYNGAPLDGLTWTGGDCSRHVIRGGSWHLAPGDLRSAYRIGNTTDNRDSSLGFRVARTLVTP
jgi:formylglycine-generating enzyme required for sulfatase activity